MPPPTPQYLWLHSIEPAVCQLLLRLYKFEMVPRLLESLCTSALFKLCSSSFWELTELGRHIDLATGLDDWGSTPDNSKWLFFYHHAVWSERLTLPLYQKPNRFSKNSGVILKSLCATRMIWSKFDTECPQRGCHCTVAWVTWRPVFAHLSFI